MQQCKINYWASQDSASCLQPAFILNYKNEGGYIFFELLQFLKGFTFFTIYDEYDEGGHFDFDLFVRY